MAGEHLRRGVEAERLLDPGGHQIGRVLGIGEDLGHLFRVRGEVHERVAEQLGGGLVAGHHHQDQEGDDLGGGQPVRSEEHTSELQSLMRISYAVFCLKKKKQNTKNKLKTYDTHSTNRY